MNYCWRTFFKVLVVLFLELVRRLDAVINRTIGLEDCTAPGDENEPTLRGPSGPRKAREDTPATPGCAEETSQGGLHGGLVGGASCGARLGRPLCARRTRPSPKHPEEPSSCGARTLLRHNDSSHARRPHRRPRPFWLGGCA